MGAIPGRGLCTSSCDMRWPPRVSLQPPHQQGGCNRGYPFPAPILVRIRDGQTSTEAAIPLNEILKV